MIDTTTPFSLIAEPARPPEHPMLNFTVAAEECKPRYTMKTSEAFAVLKNFMPAPELRTLANLRTSGRYAHAAPKN